MKAAIGFLLFPLPVLAALIGQSQKPGTEPIPWTDCAWCVSDANDNVYLPDGWLIRAGRRTAEKMSANVSGRLYSNGSSLFAWTARNGVMTRVKPTDGGLAADGTAFRSPKWDVLFAFAPDGCTEGFAADGRFFVYEKDDRKVVAYGADGTCVGEMLDVGAQKFKTDVTAIAIHPQSGDLILQTYYPQCFVRRFRRDGTEVKDGVWPQAMFGGGFAYVSGELWGFRGGAWPVRDRLGVRADGLGGGEATETRGVAWGGDGWWLATTQGALFYSRQDRKRCIKRLGGVSGVSAFAVSPSGEIIASAGNRILAFWLDDGPDDAPHSNGDWMWSLGGRWGNDRVESVVWRNGLFLFREEREPATWALDLSVNQWVRRRQRMFKTNEVVSVTATDTTCGNWSVSYDAEKRAFVRERKK